MSSYSQKRAANNGQQPQRNDPEGLVLQKQLPSSQVPRFNPHGAAANHVPKPKQPERENNYYSPAKRNAKAKLLAEAQVEVDFTQFNIEELLLTSGVEFRNPEKVNGGWLPLEAYDNKDIHDKKLPHDYLKSIGGRDGVGAQGLWKDKDGLCYWRKLRILKYLPKSERYEGFWENTKEKTRLHRIYILFDEEDPRLFARRFKDAYSARIHADALIKYNYYIENMPTHQIPEIDNYQVNRILSMTQNTKSLRGKSSSDTTTLLNEINVDFAKTMNNIIFDKHLNDKGTELITGQLKLPEKPPKKETAYFGMISIPVPDMDYPEKFLMFSCNTLQVNDEVIRAQQEIRKECNDVACKDIYNLSLTKTMKVEEFIQIQASSISQNSYYLKETWVNKIKEIIKTNFADCASGEKPSYNLLETNYDVYQRSKLKRFLTQTKFIMQDTLLDMTKKSVQRYVDSIISFLPHECTVIDSNTVENVFQTAEERRDAGAALQTFPLFQIDLTLKDNQPTYSNQPWQVLTDIIRTFENGIKALQEICQIEQKLLPHLFKSNVKMYLKSTVLPDQEPEEPDKNDPRSLPDENKWVWEQFVRLKSRIREFLSPLEEYQQQYNKYEKEYALDPEEKIRLLDDPDNPPEVDQLRRDVIFHQKEEERLRNEIPESIVVSMFKVNCKEIRNALADKHAKIARDMIELIAKMAKQKANDTTQAFENINLQIEANPKDIEELSAIKDLMAAVPNEIEKLNGKINECMNIYNTLNEFQYTFPEDDDYDKQWKLLGSPQDTLNKIDKHKTVLEKEKDKFVNQMHQGQEDFSNTIADLENVTSSFVQFQDINQFEEVAAKAKDIKEKLDAAITQAKIYNNCEMLTGQEETEYGSIHAMAKEFKPLYDLWTTTELWRNSYKSWLHDDFDKLDAVAMEEITETSGKTMASVTRMYRDKELPGILKIGEIIKGEVDEFRPFVPLALALRNEGMKERHWQQITDKVQFQVKPYEGFTFQHVLDMNLFKWVDDIVDIGDRAGKEYTIEMNMNKMRTDWESIHFNLIAFKKTNTYTVTGYDDALQLLDEHQLLTQAMQFSPFKKPFEEDIEEWSQSLLTVSNCLDEWVRCQGQWMYLQPIFDSPDIMKQLPSENKKFKNVDKNWREIINTTRQNPNVLKSCLREGLLERFQECNKNLDIVQIGLKEYLETKRGSFARFYFLSDSDLLEILSQTKEVENVKPHLRKVFENVADLTFETDKTITSMSSGEGETIQFVSPVDPKDKGVEFWMGEVEDMMFMSVRQALLDSVLDYKEIKRTEWVLKHPGQCVLNGSQVHWTTEVEEAMNNGYESIKAYLQKLRDQLTETVDLVRQRLTKLQSITLGALIVIDVHAMVVIEEIVEQKITDITKFQWVKQLRYYWEDDDCRVKCIQTNFPYGYEYLGNTQRLVITPLTDKCYMTLMGALKLNLGGAPAGPAGTGKTESTKDLAKALAKQCVVFNCSDSMDITLISNFFKGLAAAGAWCCFDEFNRINIEVLSVIAQMLSQLFGAKGGTEDEITFNDSLIKLKPTFCVFITMNPGYAGRTELPDNLVALFRPVAMMVPDYALIGQIMLMSFGFQEAKVLAQKMVTTFRLASEQLSSQDHYDYGMRAVRSVINAAGLLKRESPDMNEDQLLLRALRDVNVPKFLKDDLPLFENIIKDLFPGVEKPNIDYGKLLEQMKLSCVHKNLQHSDIFVGKMIQLYDTIRVRHGLMIVGPTGGGKTCNYQTLAHAMTELREEEDFEKVNYHIVNPKSVTMGQLYGDVDPQTTEWVDGVLAKKVADCAKDQSTEKHWIMLDGPVDAIWIENMNTVLDDNKKLCLNSGQIIQLSNHMTMMFEVEDLAVASPATVSRCGMVYMEPGALGYEPLITSWLNTTPPLFRQKKGGINLALEKLFAKYLHELLRFVRKNCPEPVETMTNNLVSSLLKILDCYFVDYRDTEVKQVKMEEVEAFEKVLEAYFVFAIVWSLGATTTLEGREKFNVKLKELMGKDAKFKYPNAGSCYDYAFNRENEDWQIWTETVKPYDPAGKLSYSEIIVPTFDSIRMKHVKKLLITNKKHVLCPGPTGTGKTVNINILLNLELGEDYSAIPITFSAQTSANQTQNALDEKFDKRRKGHYGPPTGKRFVVFIDDLNMPKREEYGAQPPIELLRQWMDHGGWYDLISKDKAFMWIEDIILVSAMGPPGGGRSRITARLQRHYNLITYTNLGKESISMIFNKIVKLFLGGFSDEITANLEKIVESTQKVYNGVETNLKPTPAKSHYTFNLRDMSKIFQGVCAADKKTMLSKVDLIRLWIHENQRVFGDRMISEEDKEKLASLYLKESETTFQLAKGEIFESERIVFGDFFNGIDGDNRPYIYINDLPKMVRKIEEYLQDMNDTVKIPMNLVMFLDACDHVARICRVLRQPMGNALLLGVGGSGRQSLSRLSTYMNSYKIFQIEVTKSYGMRDWKENLKTCLMQAGVDGKPTTFLFVDTQIINEQFLEDINNVLNAGDVAGLYKAEDFEGITQVGKNECIRKGLAITKMNMFSCYVQRVKDNIHCVLAMSPLDRRFTTRLRMFPSLINCCTIDWFTNWPAEALYNVAKGAFSDETMQLGDDEEACVEMCKDMHMSVEKISVDFLNELRRQNYVTPTSYLELLNMYKTILTEQRNKVGKAKKRLERGLNVLQEAAVEVANLQRTLEENQPKLEATQIKVEETKKDIEIKTKDAEATKVVVAKEEEEATKQEAEVSGVKNAADAQLGKALPALEIAVQKVQKINVNDFYEIKQIQIPHPSVVACFKVASFFLLPKERPKKPTDPKKAEHDPEGYYALAFKNFLTDPKKFLRDLINFDKENIPDAIVEKAKPILETPELAEKKVESASKALVPIRIWVVAMITYHETLKIVNPLREQAAEMGAKLAVVQANLAEKRAMVQAINDKLQNLSDQQAKLVQQAKDLKEEMEDCQKKLVRAEKMIGGLEGEKTRWTETVAQLGEQQELLIGDCLIAAGMVSYAGPFTAHYREQLETSWREKLVKSGVKLTQGVTMMKTLGNEVTIRSWGVAGLPSDNLSVENGIIMFGSKRWPLMIDPQNQANKFIKNLGKMNPENQLEIVKLSDNNLNRSLEIGIQLGKWMLLENIGSELDPSLEPILLKQLTKQGTNYFIKIGDKDIQYNHSFKFFLTTTLPNPHYSPEASVKVTILNFAITPAGLEEQMLNLLVQLELPELQEKKNQIVEENAQSAKMLYDIEDKILGALDEAEQIMDLLKTDDMIDILADSNETSTRIKVRQEESKKTEKEIDITREGFRPVAFRSSLLFFCIVDLNTIDPMYQYSLQWFQRLFGSSVNKSRGEEEIETTERVNNLNLEFTLDLYRNVCRSLFERHKLLFSFLLCTKILFGANEIDLQEWRFFLAGPSGSLDIISNPTDWLDDIEWAQVYRQLHGMEKLKPFSGIVQYFIDFHKKFKKIFDSQTPHEERLPGEWDIRLNSFHKMILLKSIRSDKIQDAIRNYITEKIGKQYIDPPTFNLKACFEDSSNISPLIFVLSKGSDPVADFSKFVDEASMGDRAKTISLGKGQEKKACDLIELGQNKGFWVLLQNCHLALSWMPALERIVEKMPDLQMHPDFRLWLTSNPSPKFPVSTLQNSVKMTLEPPTGIRQNMLRTYAVIDNRELNDCNKPKEFKKLLFGFALFHAIVQDRRKFGPIGWNIFYPFTFEDFTVCKTQLKLFVNQYDEMPYEVLCSLGAEINYGGRVTDDKDVRLINSILQRFIQPDIMKDDFAFSDSGKYRSIPAGDYNDYITYLKQLPQVPEPEAFGLHENAEITTNQNEARIILENVLSIQPRSSGSGGVSREDQINEMAKQIQEQTPQTFDIEAVLARYPTDYNESMNTVLTQELIRYNRLLVIMAEMLVNIQKALIGEVVMSDDLEKMATSLFDNQVPKAWADVGFLSLKPLASWIIDLNDRVTFLQKWIDGGPPATYWISGFFFPQAFFTGTLQNYARKNIIAIDELDFDFKMYDELQVSQVTEKPEDGCFCYGLYMEGARWNSTTHQLDDSKPKQLYTELPLIWFLPKRNRKQPETGIYVCPVYKVLSRAGTLSTTGHSTNFCLNIELPTKEDQAKWIRAGVGAFLALRY